MGVYVLVVFLLDRVETLVLRMHVRGRILLLLLGHLRMAADPNYAVRRRSSSAPAAQGLLTATCYARGSGLKRSIGSTTETTAVGQCFQDLMCTGGRQKHPPRGERSWNG